MAFFGMIPDVPKLDPSMGADVIERKINRANRATAAQAGQSGLANTGYLGQLIGLNELRGGEMQEERRMDIAETNQQAEMAEWQAKMQLGTSLVGSLLDIGAGSIMLKMLTGGDGEADEETDLDTGGSSGQSGIGIPLSSGIEMMGGSADQLGIRSPLEMMMGGL